MNEIQTMLEKAFNLLDVVLVRGCDVEKVANIKLYLSEAFRLAGESESEGSEVTDGG